uniref:Uncharacterized protein n=1 Tax=viral metagenome TaxID=1070528 RepID=A0A6C0E0H0_9ZZZZ
MESLKNFGQKYIDELKSANSVGSMVRVGFKDILLLVIVYCLLMLVNGYNKLIYTSQTDPNFKQTVNDAKKDIRNLVLTIFIVVLLYYSLIFLDPLLIDTTLNNLLSIRSFSALKDGNNILSIVQFVLYLGLIITAIIAVSSSLDFAISTDLVSGDDENKAKTVQTNVKNSVFSTSIFVVAVILLVVYKSVRK